jgi:ribosomal protein S18 acetylase RimI-like enzyme
MRIEIAAGVDADLVAGFDRLIPQLSSSNPPPTTEQLAAIVSSPATDLIVAYDDDGVLIGSLTLASFRIPTGLRARIEDVVVDESARGQGVGEALSLAALDRARSLGARTVDLSSRPSRVAANRLYQRLGFEQRETVVYRKAVGGETPADR